MTSRYPANADMVIVQHYWWNDATKAGVNLPVTWTPLGYTGTNPNLTDITAHGWIKTQAWTAKPDADTGYMAVPLTASNDPDLTGFPGYEVAPQGETSFTIAIDDATPTVPATADMVAALAALTPPVTLTVSTPVRAVWLTDVATVSPSPTPPSSFFTAAQTTDLVVDAIDTHDTDPDAHPDIRALIGQGGGGGVGPYVHTQSSAAATWTITHNLGRYPQVTVVDDARTRFIADIAYPSLNAVTVVHAAPVTGSAYLI